MSRTNLEQKDIDIGTQVSTLTTQQANITNNGEIKGFKPVTQAEYDALTTEQKNDGTVYLIEEA